MPDRDPAQPFLWAGNAAAALFVAIAVTRSHDFWGQLKIPMSSYMLWGVWMVHHWWVIPLAAVAVCLGTGFVRSPRCAAAIAGVYAGLMMLVVFLALHAAFVSPWSVFDPFRGC